MIVEKGNLLKKISINATIKFLVFFCIPIFCGISGTDQSVIIKSTQDETLKAIWNAGEIRDIRTVPQLIALLKDSCYSIRQYAAVALGKINDNRAIDPLIDCVIAENPGIENTATFALSRFGKPAICRLIKRYVTITGKSDDPDFYEPAIAGAARIERILFQSNHRNTTPALLPLPDSESVVNCLPYPYNGMGKQLQKLSVDVIANSNDTTVFDILTKLLLFKNYSTRDEICRKLISIGDKRTIPFLLEHGNGGDSLLPKWKTIELLTAMPEIGSIDFLKENISQNNCYNIAQALKKIGNSIAPEMVRWLEDSSVALRCCASLVLSEIDCSEYKSMLIPLLNDTSAFLRGSIINAMKSCKDSTLSPYVYKLINDTGISFIRNAIERYREEENIWVVEKIIKRMQYAVEKDTLDTLLLNDVASIVIKEKERALPEWSGTYVASLNDDFRKNLIPFLEIFERSTHSPYWKKVFEIKTYAIKSKRNTSIQNGLNSEDPEMVLLSLRSIVISDDDNCYNIPVHLFNHKNFHIRYFAAIAASRCTSEVYIPSLLSLLKETNTVIPKGIVKSVIVVDSLIKFDMDIPNQNNNEYIQLLTVADAAAYALGCIGDKKISNALREYLDKCNMDSKKTGLVSFKRVVTDSDVALLRRYLNKNIPSEIRELAMGCMFRLDIKKTRNTIIEYIHTHADFAAIVGLKILCKKSKDDITNVAIELVNKLINMNEKYSNLAPDEQQKFWDKMPRDSVVLHEYASRLLIQSAIEMLSMGQQNGIIPAMKILNSYSYDCCATGETWESALGRVPIYENKAAIDTLIVQLKANSEDKKIFEHYWDVLKKQNSRYAVNEIVKLLSNDNPVIRLASANILFHTADSTTVQYLEPFLDDSLAYMRLYAFSILYKLNSCNSAENLVNSIERGLLDTIDKIHTNSLDIDKRDESHMKAMEKWHQHYRFFEELFHRRYIDPSGMPERQMISTEFHKRLFQLVLSGNSFAEYFIRYDQVCPDSSIAELFKSREKNHRLGALKVYLAHPGSADPNKIVCLLEDEDLEVQVLAGKYILSSGVQKYYYKIYNDIMYDITRFPSQEFRGSFLSPLNVNTLIELCTDTSAIKMHKEIVHLKKRELRFSSYKALIKMNGEQAKALLLSPLFPEDHYHIKDFRKRIADGLE